MSLLAPPRDCWDLLMRSAAARAHRHPSVLEAAPRRPVLIVKVDGAGIDQEGAPAGRCDVRLLHSVRGRSAERSLESDRGDGGREVTAVVILRDATPASVVSCVRAATRGGPISPELLGQLRPLGEEAHVEPAEPQLSDREYDVLRMLADGESTRGIATQLSYSERTVKNIIHDLLEKLNCKTRAHAVALAMRQGVI